MNGYVSRDNFRFLTGHGRVFAEKANYLIEHWNVASGGVFDRGMVPTGNLILQYDVDRSTFHTKFQSYGDGSELHSAWETSVSRYGSKPALFSIAEIQGERCEVITVPVAAILRTAPDISHSFQIYQHSYLNDDNGRRLDGQHYIGLTKRGWRTRWNEHIRAAASGSQYRFHQAIRKFSGTACLTAHTLMACGLTEAAALDLEEKMIEHESLHPRGLNMIPGGKAGLAYLRQIGALGKNERVSPDERQDIINRFFERTSRKGLPNPLAAANWLNPHYAEQVICAGPDRLKPQQVRDTRYLASIGRTVEDIAATVGARNIAQIRRVISGETYSRIA